MEVMTIVVLLCIAHGEAEVCHEEIAGRQPSNIASCVVSMSELVEWKMHSAFKADEWLMKRIDCHRGDYKPKEAI